MKRKKAKTRRRAVTLLEVVIALGLTSIVLFFLFGYYRQLTMIDLETEKVQECLSARARVQTRLMQIFASFPKEEKEGEGFLYTDTTPEGLDLSLLFAFDQGIDSDPKLCGLVKAVLFLSRDKKLKLRILAIDEKTEARDEVLMENVKSLAFSFFDPAEEKWESDWKKDAASFPSMIKVILTEIEKKKEPVDEETPKKLGASDNSIQYAFFLPASQLAVEYEL